MVDVSSEGIFYRFAANFQEYFQKTEKCREILEETFNSNTSTL